MAYGLKACSCHPLSNQDKGCTPSVAHSLALPLGSALHNVWNNNNDEEGVNVLLKKVHFDWTHSITQLIYVQKL